MPEQKMVETIKDPKTRELFDNPNYSRVLKIMRNKKLTVKEIHKRFNKDYEDTKTLTSLYRYIKKLKKHDLVYVCKQETKKGHLLESYYSRTAQFFIFPKKWTNENVITATAKLVKRIFELDKEKEEDVEKLLHEHSEKLNDFFIEFYKEYGEKVLQIERKYGFDTAKKAADMLHELQYFRKNPELLERLFDLLTD